MLSVAGHSVEALPPTPFRLQRVRNRKHRGSVQTPRAQPASLPWPANAQPAQASFLLRQTQSKSNSHNNGNDRLEETGIGLPLSKLQLLSTDSPPDNLPDSLSNRSKTQSERSKLLSRGSSLEASVRGSGRKLSVEFNIPEILGITKEDSSFERQEAIRESEDEREISYALSADQQPGRDTLTITDKHHCRTESKNSTVTSSISPLSREITEILQYVREKNKELLAVKSAAVAINSNSEMEQENQKDTDQHKLLMARSKRLPPKLPNTRYKCRTCIERLRDNARFRQSLKQKATHDTQENPHNLLPKLPAKDLDGNVIDASGKLEQKSGDEPTTVQRAVKGATRNQDCDTKTDSDKGEELDKPHRPGYSRSRLEQLAVPRGGPRPRLKISGRVLRRQAEVLRRSHNHSQLSEREQERVLRLQSRVSLFLALLQERQSPSRMVHIPQRDDIMYVDISHLG